MNCSKTNFRIFFRIFVLECVKKNLTNNSMTLFCFDSSNSIEWKSFCVVIEFNCMFDDVKIFMIKTTKKWHSKKRKITRFFATIKKIDKFRKSFWKIQKNHSSIDFMIQIMWHVANYLKTFIMHKKSFNKIIHQMQFNCDRMTND